MIHTMKLQDKYRHKVRNEVIPKIVIELFKNQM